MLPEGPREDGTRWCQHSTEHTAGTQQALNKCPFPPSSFWVFFFLFWPLSSGNLLLLLCPPTPSGPEEQGDSGILLGPLTGPVTTVWLLLPCYRTQALPILEVKAPLSPLATKNGQWSSRPRPWQHCGWFLLLPPQALPGPL